MNIFGEKRLSVDERFFYGANWLIDPMAEMFLGSVSEV
jgi:hypothetical protein